MNVGFFNSQLSIEVYFEVIKINKVKPCRMRDLDV
jgi:hypothetical protein